MGSIGRERPRPEHARKQGHTSTDLQQPRNPDLRVPHRRHHAIERRCPPADRRSRSPHLLTAEPIRGSAEKPKPRRTSRAARARAPLRRGDSQRHGAAYAFLPARRTATSPSRGGVVRPKGGVPGPEKASMLIRRGVLRPTPRRCSSARSCDVRRRAASPRRTNGEGTAAEEPAASQSPEASWIEVSP